MRPVYLVILVVCAISSSAVGQTLTHVRIEIPEAPAVAWQLERAGFDVLEGSITQESVDLIVSPSALDDLESAGFQLRVIAAGRPFRDIQTERQPPGRDVPTGYPDLATVLAEMNATAASYPAICQVVDLTTTYGIPATVEGRHISAIKISDNVAQDEDEPAYMVVSAHHVREIVTPVIALHAIEQFTTQYGIDPDITALVDEYEIWIAPVWNPDGYVYVFDVDNLWRKNRHVFAGGVGVDLNRNYPFGWDSACSGSTSPSSDIYKGPGPGSEAETQTMIAWSQDRRFAKVHDFHSYGRETLHGYACLSHPFGNFWSEEAITCSTAAGYGGDVRSPSADGEHFQWQLAMMGAHAFLTETHTSFQPTYASAQAEAAQVFPALIWQLQRGISVNGHVTDVATGNPVVATISYDDVAFQNGETNTSGGPFGRYHAFIPAGDYALSFAAAGFDTMTLPDVTVTATGTTTLEVALYAPAAQLASPNGGENLMVEVPTTVTWSGNADAGFQVQYTSNYGDIQSSTDSFEGLGGLDPAYTTGGDADWLVTTSGAHTGARSAQAGDIGDSQVSWLTRSAGQGDLSFWYRVSSEANYDYFNFYVDGDRKIQASGTTGAWTYFSTTLPIGRHTLKWEYSKDSSSSSGDDTVWIDDFEISVDNTSWSDIIAMTAPGAMSAPWTPTVPSEDYKVRVQAHYPGGGYGTADESDATFVVQACVLGDIDIAVFADIMVGSQVGTEYERCAADVNNDGWIDGRDVQVYVSILLED